MPPATQREIGEEHASPDGHHIGLAVEHPPPVEAPRVLREPPLHAAVRVARQHVGGREVVLGVDADPLRCALGYCYYVHRGREHSSHIRDLVDRHLDTALELGWFEFHASLYRGHNAYDFANFDVAAAFFDRARQVAPKNYIGLKAFEMEACTALSRGHFAEFVEKAKAFAEEAERLDYEVENLWPRELVRALAQHAASMPEDLRTTARGHLASIDTRGRLNGWLVEALDGVDGGSGAEALDAAATTRKVLSRGSPRGSMPGWNKPSPRRFELKH